MTTVLISGADRGPGLKFVRRDAAEGSAVIAGARSPGSRSAKRAG